MGTLPDPEDWSRDPRTRSGGRLDKLQQGYDRLQTARDFVFLPVRLVNNSVNLPTTWGSDIVGQDLAVPKGYSQAIVSLTATAGASFTGTSGNAIVGVWPGIGFYNSDDAISNGAPGQGAVSAPSVTAGLVANLGSALRVSARAYAAAGGSLTVNAGSGNVHLAGFAIFLR